MSFQRIENEIYDFSVGLGIQENIQLNGIGTYKELRDIVFVSYTEERSCKEAG